MTDPILEMMDNNRKILRDHNCPICNRMIERFDKIEAMYIAGMDPTSPALTNELNLCMALYMEHMATGVPQADPDA